jgi:hypothetical protein
MKVGSVYNALPHLSCSCWPDRGVKYTATETSGDFMTAKDIT